MEQLAPLSLALRQASLQGLGPEVEFVRTVLASITVYLNSRGGNEPRTSVIKQVHSKSELACMKIPVITGKGVFDKGKYETRLEQKDSSQLSTQIELCEKNVEHRKQINVEKSSVISQNTNKVKENQQVSVLRFSHSNSKKGDQIIDKNKMQEDHVKITDDIIISSDDSSGESEYSDYSVDGDSESKKNSMLKITERIANHMAWNEPIAISDINEVFTENSKQSTGLVNYTFQDVPSKDDDIPKYEATLLTQSERSYIKNNLTNLYQLASAVPVVLKRSSLPCKLCDFQTGRNIYPVSRLREHVIGEHLLCDLCGKKFESEIEQKKHFDWMHKRKSKYFICGIAECKIEISQDYNLSRMYRHVVNKHADIFTSCRVCKKTFQLIKGLRKHESNMHNIGTYKKDNKKKEPCLVCGKPVVGKNMSIHIERIHSENPKLMCSYCNYETRKGEGRMKRHEQLHLTDKIGCNLCTYSTRAEDALLKHKVKVHELGEIYMCTSCDYKTELEKRLKRHELTHSIDSPYTCDQCDFKTKTPHSLKIHSFYHQDPKFVCDNCEYTSHSSANLYTHKVVKHQTAKHECAQCGKLFHYKRHLHRHQASHTGADLQCSECDTTFYRKDKLKNHLRDVHQRSEMESAKLTSEIKDHPHDQTFGMKVNSLRNYNCTFCPKKFTCSKHLSRHKNSVHSLTELSCQFCMKTFSRKDKLIIHTSYSCRLRK